MCFSVQADVVGGLAVSSVGIDVLRHVGNRREYLPLAALPLLFGLHQLDEVFVWLALQGHVSQSVGRDATWAYLLFAFVLLPTYVPFAVRRIEPRGRRRIAMDAFLVIGVGVSITLLIALLRGPVRAQLALNHLSYSSGLSAGWPIVAAYVVATCGSLVVSRVRMISTFGIVNMVAVAGLAYTVVDGFASLWCFWAAVTSAAFAAYLRYGIVPRRGLLPEHLGRLGNLGIGGCIGVPFRARLDDDLAQGSGERERRRITG